MDYLYGEMSDQERKEFEAFLEANPSAKAELEAFQEVRQHLPADDAPAASPPIMVMQPRQPAAPKRWLGRQWLGVAAAVLLLLLTFSWLQVRMEWTDHSMVLSFGEATPPKTEAEPSIHSLIDERVNQIEETLLDARLCELEDKLAAGFAQWDKQLKATTRHPRPVELSPEMVAELKTAVAAETYQAVSEWIQTSQAYQQTQTETLLTDFSEYLAAQRKADIQLMALAWEELMTKTDQRQWETEQLIGHVINHLQQEKSP